MAVCTKTGHDSECVSRQLPSVVIGAADLITLIGIESHVEAAVGELEEVPVAAVIALRLGTGNVKDEGFNLQGKGVAEQIGGE